MKHLLLLASFFITLSAYSSCPNLEGTFHCEMMDKEWTQTVTQTNNKNGVEKFFIDVDGVVKEIITDGIIHKMPNTQDLRRITYKATCGKDGLTISIFGMYTGLPLKVKMISTISLNEEADLLLNTKGNAGGVPIPQTITICERQE
jgi:hypothetical protein